MRRLFKCFGSVLTMVPDSSELLLVKKQKDSFIFFGAKKTNQKKHPPILNPSLYEPTEKVAPFRTGLHKLTLL